MFWTDRSNEFVHSHICLLKLLAIIYNFIFKPADITVTLLDDQHNPLSTWSITKAYPVKWTTSDFKAQENSIAIETLELAYQNFIKTDN